MTKNKLKPIDVSKYTVTDTGQVLKMNKEVEVIQRPTYAELEEKISILLSCKNCPENKGGLLCQKEYEDKCLAQKIQYIKELEKENTELKEKLNNFASVAEERLANWQKYEKAYNEAEELLDKQIEATYKVVEENKEAKEIIKKFSEFANLEVEYDPEHPQEHTDLWNELCKEAEQFLKECE